VKNHIGVVMLCLVAGGCATGGRAPHPHAGFGAFDPFVPADKQHDAYVTLTRVDGKLVIDDVPDIPVPGSGNHIFWNIRRSGVQSVYWPTSGGIVFEPGAPFGDCWKQNENIYRCSGGRDKSVRERWKYTIKLENVPEPKDPFVVNN
jgi:hypothetical protein